MWRSIGVFWTFMVLYPVLAFASDALTENTSGWRFVFYAAFYLLGCIRGWVDEQ